MKANRERLIDDASRRAHKVFMLMAKRIKTRSADQCRGHHRKLMKANKSVDNIIEKLESRINLTNAPNIEKEN